MNFPKNETKTLELLRGATAETQERVTNLLVAMLGDPRACEAAAKALKAFEGPLDARLYRAMAEVFHRVPDRSIDAAYFFARRHTEPLVHDVLLGALERCLERGELFADAYAFHIYKGEFDGVRFPGTAPALAQLTAIAAQKPGWEFVNLVTALERLADPATVAPLTAIHAAMKRGGPKQALGAALAAIERTNGGAQEPRAASADPLVQRLLDAGLSLARAKAIRRQARNQIALRTAPLAAMAAAPLEGPPPGTSRFGGFPDLPEGTPWPAVWVVEDVYEPDEGEALATAKGRSLVPLPFIAQLDLAELAPHDADGLLPKAGLLSFFANADAVVGTSRDLEKIATAVLFTPAPAKLLRLAAPRTIATWHPAAITCSQRLTLPDPGSDPMQRLSLSSGEEEAYQRALDAEASAEPSHAALGWADCGYSEGIPAAKEQLLLAVRSDLASGFNFGDASSIYFCIPGAALAKADFAKAFGVNDE